MTQRFQQDYRDACCFFMINYKQHSHVKRYTKLIFLVLVFIDTPSVKQLLKKYVQFNNFIINNIILVSVRRFK